MKAQCQISRIESCCLSFHLLINTRFQSQRHHLLVNLLNVFSFSILEEHEYPLGLKLAVCYAKE